MANLTVLDVYKLVHAETVANGGKDDISNRPAEISMVSIAMAESGGNPKARNVNHKPGKEDDGSVDRGLYQFNNYWNPEISDADAYDPVKATHWAFIKSNGWKNFKPWTNSKGLNFDFKQKVGLAIINPAGGGGITGWIDAATDTSETGREAIADTLVPWAEGLAALLTNLVDPEWWKRIGIGALGVIILIVALVVIFAKPVENITTEAAGKVIKA